MKDGVLTKMTIKSFSNSRLTAGAGDFVVPINPEKYDRNLQIQYQRSQAQGTQGNNRPYKKTKPEEISFEFTFDNTGTVQGNHLDGTPVTEQIKQFLEVTYYIDGKIHAPKFLKIYWGDLRFGCRLTKVSIKYTLFNPSGTPLRAKLNATFKGYVDPEVRVRKEDKSSPDLTHVQLLEEGGSLSLMAFDIYSDTRFFLQVAKANNLTSPRLAQVGQEILLPPVKKSTT